MSANELPDELQNALKFILGMEWPEGDVAGLNRISSAWSEFSGAMEAMESALQRSGQGVQDNMSGEFADSYRGFADTLREAMVEIRANADGLADVSKNTAADIQYAKIMIIAQLVIMIAMMALQWIPFVGQALAAAAQVIARVVISQILAKVIANILLGAAMGLVLELGLDVAIQGVQMLTGQRTDWNENFTKGAAISGVVSGAVGGAAGSLLHIGVGKLGRGAGKDVGDALDEVAPPPKTESGGPGLSEKGGPFGKQDGPLDEIAPPVKEAAGKQDGPLDEVAPPVREDGPGSGKPDESGPRARDEDWQSKSWSDRTEKQKWLSAGNFIAEGPIEGASEVAGEAVSAAASGERVQEGGLPAFTSGTAQSYLENGMGKGGRSLAGRYGGANFSGINGDISFDGMGKFEEFGTGGGSDGTSTGTGPVLTESTSGGQDDSTGTGKPNTTSDGPATDDTATSGKQDSGSESTGKQDSSSESTGRQDQATTGRPESGSESGKQDSHTDTTGKQDWGSDPTGEQDSTLPSYEEATSGREQFSDGESFGGREQFTGYARGDVRPPSYEEATGADQHGQRQQYDQGSQDSGPSRDAARYQPDTALSSSQTAPAHGSGQNADATPTQSDSAPAVNTGDHLTTRIGDSDAASADLGGQRTGSGDARDLDGSRDVDGRTATPQEPASGLDRGSPSEHRTDQSTSDDSGPAPRREGNADTDGTGALSPQQQAVQPQSGSVLTNTGQQATGPAQATQSGPAQPNAAQPNAAQPNAAQPNTTSQHAAVQRPTITGDPNTGTTPVTTSGDTAPHRPDFAAAPQYQGTASAAPATYPEWSSQNEGTPSAGPAPEADPVSVDQPGAQPDPRTDINTAPAGLDDESAIPPDESLRDGHRQLGDFDPATGLVNTGSTATSTPASTQESAPRPHVAPAGTRGAPGLHIPSPIPASQPGAATAQPGTPAPRTESEGAQSARRPMTSGRDVADAAPAHQQARPDTDAPASGTRRTHAPDAASGDARTSESSRGRADGEPRADQEARPVREQGAAVQPEVAGPVGYVRNEQGELEPVGVRPEQIRSQPVIVDDVVVGVSYVTDPRDFEITREWAGKPHDHIRRTHAEDGAGEAIREDRPGSRRPAPWHRAGARGDGLDQKIVDVHGESRFFQTVHQDGRTVYWEGDGFEAVVRDNPHFLRALANNPDGDTLLLGCRTAQGPAATAFAAAHVTVDPHSVHYPGGNTYLDETTGDVLSTHNQPWHTYRPDGTTVVQGDTRTPGQPAGRPDSGDDSDPRMRPSNRMFTTDEEVGLPVSRKPEARLFALGLVEHIRDRQFDEALGLLRKLDRDPRAVWAMTAAYASIAGKSDDGEFVPADLAADLHSLAPEREAEIFYTLGIGGAESVSPESVQGLFESVKAAGYDHVDGRYQVRYDYLDEHCYYRAHLACLELQHQGVIPSKIFIAQTRGLRVMSANTADARPGMPGLVTWDYHVAPVVTVAHGGEQVLYVFDPAIEPERPLMVEEWLMRMEVDPVEVDLRQGSPEEIHAEMRREYENNPLDWNESGVSPNSRPVALIAEARVLGFPSPLYPGTIYSSFQEADDYVRAHGESAVLLDNAEAFTRESARSGDLDDAIDALIDAAPDLFAEQPLVLDFGGEFVESPRQLDLFEGENADLIYGTEHAAAEFDGQDQAGWADLAGLLDLAQAGYHQDDAGVDLAMIDDAGLNLEMTDDAGLDLYMTDEQPVWGTHDGSDPGQAGDTDAMDFDAAPQALDATEMWTDIDWSTYIDPDAWGSIEADTVQQFRSFDQPLGDQSTLPVPDQVSAVQPGVTGPRGYVRNAAGELEPVGVRPEELRSEPIVVDDVVVGVSYVTDRAEFGITREWAGKPHDHIRRTRAADESGEAVREDRPGSRQPAPWRRAGALGAGLGQKIVDVHGESRFFRTVHEDGRAVYWEGGGFEGVVRSNPHFLRALANNPGGDTILLGCRTAQGPAATSFSAAHVGVDPHPVHYPGGNTYLDESSGDVLSTHNQPWHTYRPDHTVVTHDYTRTPGQPAGRPGPGIDSDPRMRPWNPAFDTGVPAGEPVSNQPAAMLFAMEVAGHVREGRFDAAMGQLNRLLRDPRAVWAMSDAYAAMAGQWYNGEFFPADLASDLYSLAPRRRGDIDFTLGLDGSHSVSRQNLQGLFEAVKGAGYDHVQGRYQLRYDYPDDNCFIRAHLACLELQHQGVAPAKIFVANEQSLMVTTMNAPNALPGIPAQVMWDYHVAPVVNVRNGNQLKQYVLDPEIEPERPLRVSDWWRRMNVDPTQVDLRQGSPEEIHSQLVLDYNSNPNGWDDIRKFPVSRTMSFVTDARVLGFPGPAWGHNIYPSVKALDDMIRSVGERLILEDNAVAEAPAQAQTRTLDEAIDALFAAAPDMFMAPPVAAGNDDGRGQWSTGEYNGDLSHDTSYQEGEFNGSELTSQSDLTSFLDPTGNSYGQPPYNAVYNQPPPQVHYYPPYNTGGLDVGAPPQPPDPYDQISWATYDTSQLPEMTNMDTSWGAEGYDQPPRGGWRRS